MDRSERMQKIVGVSTSVAVAALAVPWTIYHVWYCVTHGWDWPWVWWKTLDNSGQANWIEAIGTVAAVVYGFWAFRKQREHEIEDRRKRELADREREARGREAEALARRKLRERFNDAFSPTFTSFLMRRNWLAQKGNTMRLMEFAGHIKKEFMEVERNLVELRPKTSLLSEFDARPARELIAAVDRALEDFRAVPVGGEIDPIQLDLHVQEFIFGCKHFGMKPPASAEAQPSS